MGYLCDVLDSILLQQPLVEPLCLFWWHLGLVFDKEANLVCVCALAMGQGTDNGVKRQCQARVTAAKISIQVRLELSFVTLLHTHMRMVWAPLGILHRVKSRLICCESSSNVDADFVFRKACKAWTAFFTWYRNVVSSFKTLYWHAKNFLSTALAIPTR